MCVIPWKGKYCALLSHIHEPDDMATVMSTHTMYVHDVTSENFIFQRARSSPSLCVCSQYYMLCDGIGNIMTGFQFSLCFFFCEMKHQSEWKYEKYSYATSHAHVDDFPRIIPSRVGAPVFLSIFFLLLPDCRPAWAMLSGIWHREFKCYHM